ncbi:MAG TPA: hypothetical protein VGF80_15835 [Galbitalea sp.]|jgi:hypothetical protein
MSTHLFVSAPPLSAARSAELGSTGLQGRRALRRRDFRAELRELLPHSTGRHRETFIPLSTFSLQSD